MFFATTKGQHVYSDPNYRDMEEVFILFGKETKGLPEELLWGLHEYHRDPRRGSKQNASM